MTLGQTSRPHCLTECCLETVLITAYRCEQRVSLTALSLPPQPTILEGTVTRLTPEKDGGLEEWPVGMGQSFEVSKGC